MSGAPDKIWVEDTSKDWFDDSGVWGVDKENQYDVEYTRSEIVDELLHKMVKLQAEVARMRVVLKEITQEYDPSHHGEIAEDMNTIALAALEYKD
jgi:hypothetical protein